MNPWDGLRRLARAMPPPLSDEGWLLRLLQRNRDTRPGRTFGFAALDSAEAYRARMPLSDYETWRSSISDMAEGAGDVLFRGRPLAFEITSGTDGQAPKLIPYSAESLVDFRQALLPWLVGLAKTHGLCGRTYWSISPLRRPAGTTRGGTPIGLGEQDYLGEEASPFLSRLSAVPPQVAGLPAETGAWLLVTLYHLVRAVDLDFLFLWSPTFFLRLIDGLEECRRELRQLLHQGGDVGGQTLPPDRDAAGRLEEFSAEGRGLWPRLRLVSAWADGAAAPFFAELQKRLPQAAFQGKGLLSTEGAVTVPGLSGKSRLAEGCGFFEFIAPDGEVLLPAQLAKGGDYRVVLTTSGGLYRYKSGDVVRCLGFERGRPLLAFVGRGGLTCDLTGEKLDEVQAALALNDLSGFRMLCPVFRPAPRYMIVLDSGGPDFAVPEAAILAGVEAVLRRNPHYAHSRDVGQLAGLEIRWLEKPGPRYDQWTRQHGRALPGVTKIPALCRNADWLNDA